MTDVAGRARRPSGVPTGGEFATQAKGENPDLDAPEPKVTDTFISQGLAWVRFEPVQVNDGRYDIMIDRAHAWAASGPRYAIGRGRIIKKDGTVGVRVLEISGGLLPANIRQAMADLLEAHQKEASDD